MLRLAERRVTEVTPLGDLRRELADVLGRVLQIVVHHHDHCAARRAQPGHDRVVLPGVDAQVDAANRRVGVAGLLDHLPGTVRAGVIHQDELVVPREALRGHGVDYPPRELRDDALAVIDRNDDRQVHRCPYGIRRV